MKNTSDGLTLVEFVIVFPITIFLVFGVIEIARLYAFKVYLQGITNDTTIMLSHRHIEILRKDARAQEILIQKTKEDIERKIQAFPTVYNSFQEKNLLILKESSINFSLNFENFNKNDYPNGVYLKINTCLPVLFSHILNKFFDDSIFIGKKNNSTKDTPRNCLGHFLKINQSYPYINFRVRSASYFPWPASTEIFNKGFHVPQKINGLEYVDNKQKNNLFKQNIANEL